MSQMKKLLGQIHGASAVVISYDLLASSPEETQQYYFLQEFLTIKHWQTLPPYTSSVSIIKVCNEDSFVFKKAFTSSVVRTKAKSGTESSRSL